jgi:hypothetical protein
MIHIEIFVLVSNKFFFKLSFYVKFFVTVIMVITFVIITNVVRGDAEFKNTPTFAISSSGF